MNPSKGEEGFWFADCQSMRQVGNVGAPVFGENGD
jgi:hypothetical protein